MLPEHDDKRPPSARRAVFVVGASAGGIEALTALVSRLPVGFPGSLFVVQHMRRDAPSTLVAILGRSARLPVVLAFDRQPIEAGTIYVAPANHHMLIERGAIRLANSPTQHRHRPAIDVTFRSAAAAYGAGVVGVLLSGLLDDGCAGLAAINECGGVVVVQDPKDALFPSMPESALAAVEVDHCLPADRIGPLCVLLAAEPASPGRPISQDLELEVRGDRGEDLHKQPGRPSPYACPECHGVLWESERHGLKHYRCRIGHAYSEQSLGSVMDQATEDALWAAVRSLEERSSLARRMAKDWRGREQETLARDLEEKAELHERHAARIRDILVPPEEDL